MKRRSSHRILLVDDDRALMETIVDGLNDLGFDAVGVGSSQEASARLAETFDVVVTDLRMPGIDGLELLALSKRAAPDRPVIVMTAYSAVDTAIESIRQGAYHYLTKPFKVDELALFLERAIDESHLRREARSLRRTVREGHSLENVIGRSGAMRDVENCVRRVADNDVPVMILGETGTGKGLIARAIHAEGRRAEKPFVTVNCAALPESLLESELFGHVRGSFTGATSDRRGLLEEAEGGTVFLDEVGDMALPLQVRLLDVLERNVVRPVGANKERTIEARIIAATHRDLHARVRSGQFREDLLFRLDVVAFEIPALRHRRDDLPKLIAHFFEVARRKQPASRVERFSADALARLLAYAWPGNVRELEHLIERVVTLGSSPVVEVADLPPALIAKPESPAEFRGEIVTLAEVQRRYATWALEQMAGRKMATAEKLDVDRKTLAKLLSDANDRDGD